MDPRTWLENTGAYHLTIEEVLKFPVGELVRIFFMDRNVLDLCCRDNPIDSPVPPAYFFRNCYMMDFRRSEGIRGTWAQVTHGDGTPTLQEFDIDAGTCWFPLKHDTLPRYDDQDIFDLGENSGKHYTSFQPCTRLGWRGPMMRASDMDLLPHVKMPVLKAGRTPRRTHQSKL
jgi:hypothetical protein